MNQERKEGEKTNKRKERKIGATRYIHFPLKGLIEIVD